MTPTEISNAITLLELNAIKCSPFDCFGNDVRKQIYAMIDVLNNQRSKEWINARYLAENEIYATNLDNVVWRSAMDARDWMDGLFEIDDLLFPEADQAQKAYDKHQIFFNKKSDFKSTQSLHVN
ncbi:hypothetical protein IM792_15490 [Mucilaginibacter sp. JRF]|uniref:hypothetical protein n=1 Tax=Mucilaginibacter sp. JRF TaxID=2780088 RepID=UPI0018824F28|nr:hypothetical protein [Mucilaginibacter sp. JRF]MBE9585859.1 hypothetical protein [Mucilaginibacter sp. JRF]